MSNEMENKINEFCLEVLCDPKTKNNPEMVAAIARLLDIVQQKYY